MLNKLSAVILLVLATTFVAAAQQPDHAADRQRTEVKKLEKLVGYWEGDGWIQQGPNKYEFRGTEIVQGKVDGVALLVEGNYRAKTTDGTQGKIIHETLAVLSYNTKTSIFDFRTFLANGSQGIHEMKPSGENAYVWGFTTPSGEMRYTITIANNVWGEIGEMSKDGKTWTKFFEMNLQKKK